MKRAVVLVDPVSSGEMLKAAAKELGFSVIGVFNHSLETFRNLYHVGEKELYRNCDEVVVAEKRDEIVQKLKALPFSIEGVVAATEGGVQLADQLALAFDVWRNPVALSEARRDKGLMRSVLKQSGLSCPGFQVCKTKEEVLQFAKTHRFPLMMKTPKGAVTSQVYRCNHAREVEEAFGHIFNEPDLYGMRADHCVIEEYISGKEYIVDTFSDGSRVHVTDVWVYEKIDFDHYTNVYYNVFSLTVTDPTYQPLRDYATRVAQVFQMERGAAHIEIKEDPEKGPTLIEIGARLAGAHIPRFLKKYTNFDPFRATIEVFTRQTTTVPDPIVYRKHFAIAFFPQKQSGTIAKIQGIEAICGLASYDCHLLSVKEGDTTHSLAHGLDTPLICFFAHADRDQLSRDVAAAHNLFVIQYN